MSETELNQKPKIYGFVNGSTNSGDVMVRSISEDGVWLAGHLCSDASWGPHDIGVTSDWQHDHYAKYYPDGFEVIWCENPKDERIAAAHAKYKAMSKDEYAAKTASMERLKREAQVAKP